MLEGLAYEPEEKKYDTGNRFYSIIHETPQIRATVDVSVEGGDFVWVSIDFWRLKEDQAYPENVLLELLTHNFGTRYVHFLYLKGTRQMRLAGRLPNRDLTPADIKAIIEEAVDVAGRTVHLWHPERWPKEESDAAPEKSGEAEPASEAPKAVPAAAPRGEAACTPSCGA